MIPLYDVLSLWELSHRWHGHHPDATDPSALPFDVLDTLRLLTRALYRHEMRLCKKNGVEYGNQQTTIDFDHYVASRDPNETAYDEVEDDNLIDGHKPPADPDTAKWEEYVAHRTNRIRFHDELVKDFPACFEQRQINKPLLEDRFVQHAALADFCEDKSITFPDFWILADPEATQPIKTSDTLDPQNGNTKLRPNQVHKKAVQAVAHDLWNESPELTVSEIIRTNAIQIECNGKLYKESTLKSWLRNVDPRPKEKRHGRKKSAIKSVN
jgi:hypothetical protein